MWANEFNGTATSANAMVVDKVLQTIEQQVQVLQTIQ